MEYNTWLVFRECIWFFSAFAPNIFLNFFF